MSKVASEQTLESGLASLFDYIINFWAILPSKSIVNASGPGDLGGLLIYLLEGQAIDPEHATIFLQWMLKTDSPDWALYSRFNHFRFGRQFEQEWPPPLFKWRRDIAPAIWLPQTSGRRTETVRYRKRLKG